MKKLLPADGNGLRKAARKADIERLRKNPDYDTGLSKKNFSVDMDPHTRQSSPWNKAAARVFSKAFRKKHPHYKRKEVELAFSNYLRSIQKDYNKIQDGVSDKDVAKTRAARRKARQNRVRFPTGLFQALLTLR